MAENVNIERTMASSGDVSAVVNPEAPDRTPHGVRLDKLWVTARLDTDGTFSVMVSGSAVEGERTAGTQIDVTETAEISQLQQAMQDLLDAYADEITDNTLEAAYEVRAIRRRNAIAAARHPEGEAE